MVDYIYIWLQSSITQLTPPLDPDAINLAEALCHFNLLNIKCSKYTNRKELASACQFGTPWQHYFFHVSEEASLLLTRAIKCFWRHYSVCLIYLTICGSLCED